MTDVTISTISVDFAPSHTTLATDATYPSRVVTLTEPVEGAGVIKLGAGTVDTKNIMLFCLYGTGSDNSVITGCRFIGWHRMQGTTPPYQTAGAVWVPVPLLEVAATLSSATGATNGVLTASHRFADTITVVAGYGNTNVDYTLNSPANNTIAHGTFDYKGFAYIEAIFDLGDATAAGVLFRTY